MVVDARIYDYRHSQLVTPQGRISTFFSERALANVQSMQLRGRIDLSATVNVLPLESAARMQAIILQQMGNPISESFFRTNIDAFVKSYWLSSAICVSEGSDGKLRWVTKSEVALVALFPEIEGSVDQTGFAQHVKVIQPSYAEIEKGRFKAVQIHTGRSGYRLQAVDLPASNRQLLPYFLLHTFAGKLVRHLQENETTIISYRRSRRVERVKTSLNPSILRPQFDPNRALRAVSPQNWHRGYESVGVFSLPDLETGEHVRIPLHKIVGISQ
ncbi:hypothetical protein ACF3MZ_13405 [Paenibacillaceae bacterium WGS1546]|uniref:hypothetical protein n=1 Tax=Cohnella sp. WGS1546 TaxID=3366810 RepID=UPI00372D849C